MKLYESISPWLIRRKMGEQQPTYRWVIFTYAGSSPMVFYPFASQLDEAAEVLLVNLPGRGSRMNEPLMTDLDKIVGILKNELEQLTNLPTVYFGYSLGSLIAYELTHQQVNTDNCPQLLIVGAGSAPHKIGKRDKVYNLNQYEFWEKVKSYGGLPDEVLNEPELVKMVEPILRADFSLIDCYRYEPKLLLSIPIISIAGKDDKVCPPEFVCQWKDHTDNAYKYFEFNSGHFFINEAEKELVNLINNEVNELVYSNLKINQ